MTPTQATPLDFGKCRGLTLAQIDDNYLGWLVQNLIATNPWRVPVMAEALKRIPDVVKAFEAASPPTQRAPARSSAPTLYDTEARPRHAEQWQLTTHAVNKASLLLFDRYLVVREKWKDAQPGLCTWLQNMLHYFMVEQPKSSRKTTGGDFVFDKFTDLEFVITGSLLVDIRQVKGKDTRVPANTAGSTHQDEPQT